MNPLFRRFHHSSASACSYLLADEGSRRALLIDPVLEDVPLYLAVLGEAGLQLDWALETHLHADHLSGAARLCELTGASLACPAGCGIAHADRYLADREEISAGELQLRALACPGHAPASHCYLAGDRLFSGDTLLIGSCGTTDEPGANPGQLYDSVVRRLFALPDETLLYPGHADARRWVSCIGEEKRANPMFCGVSRDEFIALCARRPGKAQATPTTCLEANRIARPATRH